MLIWVSRHNTILLKGGSKGLETVVRPDSYLQNLGVGDYSDEPALLLNNRLTTRLWGSAPAVM